MRINNNVAALSTYSRLSEATGAQGNSLEKLSSGLRSNRAGDNAAGLAISEKMRGQIKGLGEAGGQIKGVDEAVRESQDALAIMRKNNHGDSLTISNEAMARANQSTAAVQQGQNTVGSVSDFPDAKTKSIYEKGISIINNSFSGDVKLKSMYEDVISKINDALASGNTRKSCDAYREFSKKVNDYLGSIHSNSDDMKSRLSEDIAKTNLTTNMGDYLVAGNNYVDNQRRNQDFNPHFSGLKLGGSGDSKIKTIESLKNNILKQAPTAMLAQGNSTPGAVLNLLA